ncbi:MAG: FHA domain-containing protein [Planctomycetota bacterium]|jgi:adenylate cyclase
MGIQGPWIECECDGRTRLYALAGRNHCAIGRHEANDLTFDEHLLSRRHALLHRFDEDRFSVIDLGSRNGTFVNGHRVTAPVGLRDGDFVRFGPVHAVYRFPQEAYIEATLARSVCGATHMQTQQRVVSVLVVDVCEFTPLTRQLGDQELMRVMGAWFDRAERVLQDRGCVFEKHVGDAIMAVWSREETTGDVCDVGANTSDDRAAMGALAGLFEEARRMNQDFDLPDGFRIGAGLNSGLATVVNTGSGACVDFTAMGDSVNMAFRLESATRQLGKDVVVGANTFDRLGPEIRQTAVFDTQTVSLKGYPEPCKVYAASGEALSRAVAAC